MTFPGRGFRISLFGVDLGIFTDSPESRQTLDRYVMPWLPREPLDGHPIHRFVEVRTTSGSSRVEILAHAFGSHSAPSLLAAIPFVQYALDELLISRLKDAVVVHGGVVGHRGRAILLPGPPTAGKTTLVAELVRRGAQYLSDEYAIIDAAGLVHPYPRAMLVREGDDRRPVLAEDLGGTVGREPMPAGLVIGLGYAAGATLTLTTVTQGEGVLLLLRNTPQVLADQPWIFGLFERAVADAVCYEGQRGEADEAASAILRLAESGS